MKPSVATGYIQLLPSMDGFGKQILTGGQKDAAAAGGVLGGKLGKAAILGIAAAGIGAVLKKSITEGAKLEQSLGGVETLYKKHADIVIKNANKAWKTAGISANDYMEQSTSFAASLLQSLGGNTKKAAEITDMAIIDMSDNANKFGTDMQRIQDAYQGFAKQNYTMLDNLKLGYGGTKTEMERLLADAEELSGKEYDISNLSDVYEAIHVIQEELGVTGTTAEEAASTLSGSFASMKASFDNFMGQLMMGDSIDQALSGLVTSASTFLFENLIPAVMNVATALPGALITGIFKGIPALLQGLGTIASTMAENLSQMFLDLGDMISGAIRSFANDPSVASNGITLIVNLVKGIILGLPKIIEALWEMKEEIFLALWDLAVALFEMGKEAIKEYARGMLENLAGKLGIPLNKMGSIMTMGLGGIVEKARKKFQDIKEAIFSPIETARQKVQSALQKIKGYFPLKIGKIFSGLKIPSISVSGGKAPFGIGGKGSLPKFHVNWNAEGGIFDRPTVLQGVGEAGAEAIVPLTVLWQKLDAIAMAMENGFVYMADGLESGLVAIGDTQIVLNDREFGRAVRRVR